MLLENMSEMRMSETRFDFECLDIFLGVFG